MATESIPIPQFDQGPNELIKGVLTYRYGLLRTALDAAAKL